MQILHANIVPILVIKHLDNCNCGLRNNFIPVHYRFYSLHLIPKCTICIFHLDDSLIRKGFVIKDTVYVLFVAFKKIFEYRWMT